MDGWTWMNSLIHWVCVFVNIGAILCACVELCVCVCVLMCVYIHQTISSQQRHETKNKTKLEEGLVYLTVEDLYIYIYIFMHQC